MESDKEQRCIVQLLMACGQQSVVPLCVNVHRPLSLGERTSSIGTCASTRQTASTPV
jgi:hypothetical protein